MKRFITIACVGLSITLCSMLLTSLAYAQGGLLEGMHNVSVPASSAITQSVDPRMAALAAKHGNGSTASHSIALYDSNSTLITSASVLITGASANTLIETQIAGNTLAGCSVSGTNFGNNYNVSLHLRATDTTNLNYEIRSVILDPNNPATPYKSQYLEQLRF